MASASGGIENGSGLLGIAIGTVTVSSFGRSSDKCTGTSGVTGTATQKSGVTEHIDALTYDATLGQTSGDVSNGDINLTFSDLFGTCTTEIAGTANATYTNSSHVMSFNGTGTLTVKSATGTGCAGVIKTGDAAMFTGDFTVTPAIVITSP